MPTVTVQQAWEMAMAHHNAGRLADAESLYRQILAVEPGHADSLHGLGVIAHQVGRNDAAADLIGRAIVLRPDAGAYHNTLGEALRAAGRADDAFACYQRALSLCPDMAAAHSNMGEVHRVAGRAEQAIACYQRAIELEPRLAQAHNNLGIALDSQGRLEESLASYRRAVKLSEVYPDAWSNMGTCLQQLSRRQEAMASYRKAIAQQPDSAGAHTNLAQALLVAGDFANAWPEYEWRWRNRDFPSPPRNLPQPLWLGGDIAGKTILLHCEQGFGDAIQFVRYVPLVAARGARVVLECQAELKSLFGGVQGIAQLVARGEALPTFDTHCPLLSLPLAFKTQLETIPCDVPYLRADPAKVDFWRGRLGAMPGRVKVGLVWAGRPTHTNDRNRSMSLSDFEPLGKVSEVTFVSMQMGEAARQIGSVPGIRPIDVTADLHDFSDTAALIAHLDLVISADTAVVHVAGALNRPAWVLLPFDPDWRWLLGRDDSPWYPSVRLFRQSTPRQWPNVVGRVAEALSARLRG